MIPAKIISKEQAERLGLINSEESGNAVAMAGFVTKGKIDKSEPEIILEKSLIRQNGKKELLFIHEDRKKELDKKGKLANYVDQFDVIEGEAKETFLKKNNLKVSRDPK